MKTATTTNTNTLALAFATLSLATGCMSSAQVSPSSATLYTFTSDQNGFDTKSYYVDTGAEVVVFDAQFTPALAQALVADIRKNTDSPIRYLVVTHPNPDKFNGASVFQELGAKVVASRATADAIPDVHAYKKYYFVNMAGMFTDATYPAQATVDVTFDKELTLDLEANLDIHLTVLDHAGVSSTQTVAFIPSIQALVVGDLVHHKAHAWLEGGIVSGTPRPDLAKWRAALSELLHYESATVYGGRGQPAAVAEAVAAQSAYLTQVESIVSGYITELGDRRAELSGSSAQTHHQAIAQRIIEAFTDYALPYMPQYSVYGLATALANG